MSTEIQEDAAWIPPIVPTPVVDNIVEGYQPPLLEEVRDISKCIQVEVTDITGALLLENGFEKVTCYELTNINVTAKMAVADRMFRMPVRRVDSGRIYLYPAFVKDGILNVVVRFPVSGQYIISDEEINIDLEDMPFHIEPIYIDVMIDTLPKEAS